MKPSLAGLVESIFTPSFCTAEGLRGWGERVGRRRRREKNKKKKEKKPRTGHVMVNGVERFLKEPCLSH